MHLKGYTSAELLSATSQAVMYRARRERDGTSVLIKLPGTPDPSSVELARQRHEESILRSFDHPSIARVEEVAPHNGSLALVMSDAGGVLLNKLIAKGPIEWTTTFEVAIGMLEAIGEFHSARVVHRNVRPDAFLVDIEARRAVLVDGALATRFSQENLRAVSPGGLEGDLPYLSPEQTGRMNRQVDLRSDLYSFGVVLYEMIAGVRPFRATDPIEIIHSHIARSPLPLCKAQPAVPEVVSAIVEKLLAKVAEDRYQEAAGLRADLRTCLARWRSAGEVSSFLLGRDDQATALRIPQKLYGRDAQLSDLASTFDRVAEGGRELLLVAGSSGVGKSVLVHELHKRIAEQRGYFISGKFDQLHRNTPYASIAHAVRELMRLVLTEPAESLARWKAKLLSAVGSNGRVLIELIPELEHVIGPQPPVPELGPTETRNRFGMVFQNLLRVMAGSDQALVIFLDDLQWADPGSLALLQLLLSDEQAQGVLIIGAYRDNEVGPGHLLLLRVEEMRAAGVPITQMAVQSLEVREVQQFVADALGIPASQVDDLARVAYEKTHGNPFFLGRFLEALHRDGFLARDTVSGRWVWDVEQIRGVMAADNVVDFMVGRLHVLPAETKALLRLSSCIGATVEVDFLAQVARRPVPEVVRDLWPAVKAGLLVPVGTEYQLLHSALSDQAAVRELAPRTTLRFLHDRAQQAAYAMASPGERPEVHLGIGRTLRDRIASTGRDEYLFDAVTHLNIARDLIDSADERLALVRLNLSAGRKAKAATAYDAAAEYLDAATAILSDPRLSEQHDLSFQVHLEAAECEYLRGQFERAEKLFEVLLGRARTESERLQVTTLRTILYSTMGRSADALRVGITQLAKLGVELYDTEDERAAVISRELEAVEKNLAGRSIESLVDAPKMSNELQLGIARLLMHLSVPAYLSTPKLSTLNTMKQVNLALQHGHSDVSPYGYMMYGLALASSLAGPLEVNPKAFEFGRFALALHEKFANAKFTANLNFVFAVYTRVFQPLPAVLRHLERAREAGLESGDLIYLSYACTHLLIVKLDLGEDLEDVAALAEQFIALMARTKVASSLASQRLARQMIAALRGETTTTVGLSDATFDEASFMESVRQRNLSFAIAFHAMVKLQLAVLYQDPTTALEMATAAETRLAGSFYYTEHPFYVALACALAIERGRPEDRPHLIARLREQRERLRVWAASCPENFEHRHQILEGVLADLEDHPEASMAAFDAAIARAVASRRVREEALANELCARMLLRRGRPKLARPYLADAHRAYRRWGAVGKARHLVEGHPELFAADGAERSPAAELPRERQDLDTIAAVRAAQTIATELNPEGVVQRLMRLVLENSGAQRGFLVLERKRRLVITASMHVDPDLVETGLDLDAEERTDLARSVVHYVARTKENVVLDDALRDRRFERDDYILARQPRSILCVPMSYQGRFVGLLYLENNVATRVFNAGRIEMLQLFASQAAIALENATLYGNLRSTTDELQRAKDDLEVQVSRRTEELNRTLSELWSEMDLARKIQTVLVPAAPQLEGYEVAGTMRPASSVGGDYFDVFRAGEDSWLTIGDVSGHGVTAGLIMMMVQSSIRTLALEAARTAGGVSPAGLLAGVNAALRGNLETIGRSQYMTLTAMRFRGDEILYAGLHQDILVYLAEERRVEAIGTSGVWVGVVDDMRPLLTDERLSLRSGDALMLFTDGLIEAQRDHRMLETRGAAEWFLEEMRSGAGPEAIVRNVLERIRRYEVRDDLTVVVASKR